MLNQSLSDISSSPHVTGDPLIALRAKTIIDKSDVAALRDGELAFGLVALEQAEAMLAFEMSAARKCREWGDLLVESLVDFVVWGERPTGVLTDRQATWLCAQIGDAPTPACLALLIAVLEEATTIPNWFASAVRMRASKAFGDDVWRSGRVAA